MDEQKASLVISFLVLRRAIGFVGISLPLVLLASTFLTDIEIQKTLSHFYHTPMRDFFVGSLWAIGLFLFAYRGYSSERFIRLFACFCAMGVALVPTAPVCPPIDPIGELACSTRSEGDVFDKIHMGLAASLLLSLAYFSLVAFPKSSKKPECQDINKSRCNVIYRICGVVILVCIVAIGIVLWIEKRSDTIFQFQPAFWLESVAILAFGISWLVKGRAILKATNPNVA